MTNQTPNINEGRRSFECNWRSELGVYLMFGVWCLVFLPRAMLNLRPTQQSRPPPPRAVMDHRARDRCSVGGLWWVQVIRSRHYVEDQRNQSYRTVRVPAPRGKILDRNGIALAENKPSYNVSLYLEDRGWREAVRQEYKLAESAARKSAITTRKPNSFEKVPFVVWLQTHAHAIAANHRSGTGKASYDARYRVTSTIVWQLSVLLDQPLTVDEAKFHKHYRQSLALPLPIYPNLDPKQVAALARSADWRCPASRWIFRRCAFTRGLPTRHNHRLSDSHR
jgi:hypothetical protein